MACSNWLWHLDEVFVRINGETHHLRRAVNHECEVLESYVTKRRDRKSALRFLRKKMKRYGDPHVTGTDKLRSYGAAMKVVGNARRWKTEQWLNNRSENSHFPFRWREQTMQRLRSMRGLQKFTSFHASSATTSISHDTSRALSISNLIATPLWMNGGICVPPEVRQNPGFCGPGVFALTSPWIVSHTIATSLKPATKAGAFRRG